MAREPLENSLENAQKSSGRSVEYMNLDKSDEIQLSCEKCGTALSANVAGRTILSDGHVHMFCQDCVHHLLIIKDGSLQL
jgi:hypothetical protein